MEEFKKIQTFSKLYLEKGYLEGLHFFMDSQGVNLDSVTGDLELFRKLINIVDAGIFRTPIYFRFALEAFESYMGLFKHSPLLPILTTFKKHRKEASEEKESCLKTLSNAQKERNNNLALLLEKKRFLKNNFSLKEAPFYPFTFPLAKQRPKENLRNDGCPVIIYENVDYDWFPITKIIHEKPAVFCFYTRNDLYHACQNSHILESLLEDEHILIFFDRYIGPQLFDQLKPKKPLYLFEYDELLCQNHLEHFPLINKAIKGFLGCASQTYPFADELYYDMYVFNALKEKKRLGDSRELLWIWHHKKKLWYDIHKSCFWEKDFLKKETSFWLSNYPSIPKKKINPKKKIHVAHIATQILDGGNAPSRRIRSLLKGYDLDKYEVSVLLSEHLCLHKGDYPPSFCFSLSSLKRGQETIKEIQEMGIRVLVANSELELEKKGIWLCEQLESFNVDIALFHCDEPLHLFAAKKSNVPIKVFMEHGTYPQQDLFDWYILSYPQEKKIAVQRGDLPCSRILFNQVGFDERSFKEPLSVNRQWFGLSDDDKIITTISNHLSHRISWSMCEAIAKILKKVPKAYYMPIGKVLNKKVFKDIFEELGVWEKVVFLGSQEFPVSLASHMDLYLNEFPFGGGMSCMDAIAAQLPILSMYSEKGPMQARQGSYYLGEGYFVEANNIDEYVNLACQILQDKNVYQDWKDKVKEVKLRLTTQGSYTQRHQEILKKIQKESKKGLLL
jgi:glycosyltransferase involved in cell wall biosynthesis